MSASRVEDRASWARARVEDADLDWPRIEAELQGLADREHERVRAYVIFGLAPRAKLSFTASVDPSHKWHGDLIRAAQGLHDAGPPLIQRLEAEWQAPWREAYAQALPDAFREDARFADRAPELCPFTWADLMDDKGRES